MKSSSRFLGFFSLSLTNVLIGINVAVYLFFLAISAYGSFVPTASWPGDVLYAFQLVPRTVIESGGLWFLTLFTSMFAHFSLGHLFVNMISLFFIGSFVERLIGKRRYFWLYIISGLAAGIFFVSFAYLGGLYSWGTQVFGSVDAGAVGASGAIFGLAGILAMILPRLRVLVFFVIPLPMWGAMILLLVGLWLVSAVAGLPVGNTAHLGGLVIGLLYGWYLRLKYAQKVARLGTMFS